MTERAPMTLYQLSKKVFEACVDEGGTIISRSGIERWLRAAYDETPEVVAVRHSFDGYGWLYTDSASGSDWYERAMTYPDAEPVYA